MTYTDKLRSALIAAFPAAPITRATIETPDASWTYYEVPDDLALLEGKAWTELDAQVLEQHATLLSHAGGALYRAILPAYLLLLAEREYHTALPFHVASQVTRSNSALDQKIFDERVGPMTAEQRAAVRHTIAFLARRAPMQEAMTVALRSW